MPPSVFVSCGEASGDLYAGALVRELRASEPALTAFGLGGPHLAAAGAELVADYRGISVTGLLEVVRILPRTWQLYRRLVSLARERRPSVLVLVDFPDFNFRLGRAVHALGIPVVYYVTPQVWAWRPGRLRTMKAFVRRALPIFPFESPIYERAGIPVEFVGHPLVDLLGPIEPRAPFLSRLDLDAARPTVALLPGSRHNEVSRVLPTLIAGARLVAGRVPGVQFIVARAPGLDDHWFAPLVNEPGLTLRSVEGATDSVLAAADAVATASGTATVQTALHGKPMVIVYRLAPLTYRLGKPFVSVETYGMANLVAGRRVATELIQDAFTPEAVADELVSLLTDTARTAAMAGAWREVRARLGGGGASRRAARAVLSVIDEARSL
ncbi:MAG: lipid-A-disaccharide synthase [Vicinamibacteraceae bacterium]|nr:lipid-A-disaccharide synthase [Vicinamibacteraceae bacterium]